MRIYKRKLLIIQLIAGLLFFVHISVFPQSNKLASLDRGNIIATNCKPKKIRKTFNHTEATTSTISPTFSRNISSLRLHFTIVSLSSNPATEWKIEIFSRDSEDLLFSFDSSEGKSDFWSAEIDENKIRIKSSVNVANSGLMIVADATILCRIPSIPQSTFKKDFEAINSQTINNQVRIVGRAVARLSIVSNSGLPLYCTGFLVAHDLIITNRHCVWTGKEAGTVSAMFDYDKPGETKTIKIGVKEIVAASCDLDFILLRLKESACENVNCSAANDRKPLSLKNSKIPNQNKDLIIIQHPGGASKQISRNGCTNMREKMLGNSSSLTDFGNRCDTARGSSGAPVFLLNQNGQVGALVGVHHLGIRSDTVGTEIPENEKLNRAVYAQQIIKYLEQLMPDILNELR